MQQGYQNKRNTSHVQISALIIFVRTVYVGEHLSRIQHVSLSIKLDNQGLIFRLMKEGTLLQLSYKIIHLLKDYAK